MGLGLGLGLALVYKFCVLFCLPYRGSTEEYAIIRFVLLTHNQRVNSQFYPAHTGV